jgi:FkbM family methyltransferase
MKNYIRYINRPEYIFRPISIYQRIFQQNFLGIEKFKEVLLPWGLKIKVPILINDCLSQSLLKFSTYDLSLTEVIWRLTDRGETTIDIGANIGYITSLMSMKVGEVGKVYCFEPNPEVYEELSINVRNWQNQKYRNIYPQKIALSNYSGNAVLNLTPQNRGEVFIDKNQSISEIENRTTDACVVSLERLDKFLEKEQNYIGVLKIDVEGHEMEVLQGAGELIYKHNIRDILFEEHHGYPSSVTQFLEENGYTIFRIWKGFWKPRLEDPNKNLDHPWEPPNYLATLNPIRANERMRNKGWKCLSVQKISKM